jgi:very-short-patch-repair endonuclease
MGRSRRPTDIHSLPKLSDFRKTLRRNLTPAEAAFWNLVKQSRFERRKFCRQHSVGNYILDFYCPSEKLAVELDGKSHYSTEGQQYDEQRRQFLESKDIIVVRFENRRVFEETEWVLDVLRANFRYGPPAQPTAHAPQSFLRHTKTTPSVSSEDDETATPPS